MANHLDKSSFCCYTRYLRLDTLFLKRDLFRSQLCKLKFQDAVVVTWEGLMTGGIMVAAHVQEII